MTRHSPHLAPSDHALRPSEGSRTTKPFTLAQRKAIGRPSERGRFLRIDDVIATIGLSRSTIYRMIESRDFPEPVPLTVRTVGWWEADVATWLESRRSTA